MNKRQKVSRRVSLATGELDLSVDDDLKHSQILVTETYLLHRLSPEYQLLIVGMGEITRYLAEIVQSADFTVTVCEPRQKYITRSGGVDGSYEILNCLPDDLVVDKFNDEYSAIVALAHDPRVDDLAIIAALESKAFYIGAMGSKLTS